ncbi:class I SAM-dependent methyltransferase [Winogradskyella tangerina]|uniref:class I SAM-dependent methyltransferase n=1 Tax=Winogradskyella tangerina TaxID=2023240 RepID=UPI000DBE5DC3|nr:class I SAM-dependent methyltransferase [Winogradskyella tangerina]
MKNIVLILSLLVCLGCKDNHPKDTDHQKHKNEEHQKEHHSDHKTANDYMHQSSVDELVKRFESPERDAYQKPEEVLNYLGDLQGKTIMDIGAGSGYFSVKLAEKGASVIAADVDDGFLNYLNNRINTNNLEGIVTRKIPYDSPNLDENEVDMVLIVNTYHHIENRPEYFKKVKTGTTDHGELVIIDFIKAENEIGPPLHHKISIDRVVNELKQAGYTSFDINVNLLPYQYIIKAK